MQLKSKINTNYEIVLVKYITSSHLPYSTFFQAEINSEAQASGGTAPALAIFWFKGFCFNFFI